jgi:hypothetical protein
VVAGLYTPEEVADFDSKPANNQAATPAQRVTIDTTAVETAPEPPAPPAEDPKEKASKVRALVLAIKDAGIPEAERKLWMSEQLGKAVESSKDLSPAELVTLMECAKNYRAQEADDAR